MTNEVHNSLDLVFGSIDIRLDPSEIGWLESRYPDSRYRKQKVALAVMLKYFQIRQCYPSQNALPPACLIDTLAKQLSCSGVTLSSFNWHYTNQTILRFRNLIRIKLNYRKTTTADTLMFIEWFKTQIAPTAPTPIQAIGHADHYFSERQIEQPSAIQLNRSIKSAQNQFELKWFDSISISLSEKTKSMLDQFIILDDGQEDPSITKLGELKQDLRKIDLDCVTNYIELLKILQTLDLPVSQLKICQRKLLLKYYQRILAERPSEIREHAENRRYGMLVVYCYIRQQEMLVWIQA